VQPKHELKPIPPRPTPPPPEKPRQITK
jgi:hypothetical protein